MQQILYSVHEFVTSSCGMMLQRHDVAVSAEGVLT